MIDLEKWNKFFRSNISDFSKNEMLDALDEKFTCPRCGRPDLPLALFPHHNKSCAFECAIGGSAIDVVSDLRAEIEDLRELVDRLRMAVRDGLTTIRWFGGWTTAQGHSHDYRGVARMANSMCKALGPEHAPSWEEFRCDSCNGLFDRQHVHSDEDHMGVWCTWCKRSR